MSSSSRLFRRSAVAALAALALVTTSACSADEPSSTPSGSEPVEYKVGLAGVLSGPAAAGGTSIANGAELAVEEINSSGFLGENTSIVLGVEDAAGDPAKSIAIYQEFADEGYSAVLCCALAGESGALAPQIRDVGVPVVATSTVLKDFAEAPLIYRPYVLPDEEGGLYDTFLDEVIPGEDIETAVVVVTADNDGMVMLADRITEGLERNGVEVLKRIETSAADTSFTSPATEIAALNPDAVVSSTTFMPTALLSRALRDIGNESTILTYAIDGKSTFDASAGALAGALFPAPFSAAFSENDLAAGFAVAYEKEYDTAPDMFAAQGYTAIWLIAEGLKRAGTGDPEALGKAMAEIEEQETVFGPLTFDNGQALLGQPGVILTWSEAGVMERWEQP